MPAILSKLNSRNAIVFGSAAALAFFLFSKNQPNLKLVPSLSSLSGNQDEKSVKSKSAKERAQVDIHFFRKLWSILKILVPGWFTSEAAFLLLVGLSLISRTYADVWMIQNGTAIESSIISRDRQALISNLSKFACAMPLVAAINNLLKYSLNELKLRFRSRLTRYLYAQYLNGFTFYKMSNLDNRISNADQLLTQDVEKFCESVVELYSNVSKPILDIVLYVTRLTSAIGFQGPAWMLVYLMFSGVILTRLRRPVGRMTVVEQQLEGEFRFINSRLIINSEEIAFYQGASKERRTLIRSFDKLMGHLRKVMLFRFSMGFVDNMVAKYVATMVGYFVVSRPFMALKKDKFATHSQKMLMEEYYKSGRMLVKLAEAIGRLALAGREMTRLAGFTARVTELIQVLQDLSGGHYVRTMVSDGGRGQSSENLQSLARPKLVPGSGRLIIKDNIIRFDRVPLVTPNGDILLHEMNFEVQSGMNVLVCGPNGCGKSSLFRILGELWPLFGGVLTKPEKGKLFYIPQRPYMTLGTLRDQVIYPDTAEDMARKGRSDADLEKYLDLVQLSYILLREGGWDVVHDWMDVLSGGEKQRIAMARLFYHTPQFAILDECTSAVSVDVEGSMYQYCRQAGITLFTVSHRKSLWKHHEYYLHMDGRGSYEFKRIDESTIEFGS